jgi:adenosine deaminase
MTAPVEFIRGLPKAELHVHIEGTLEPELRLALAERNGIPLAARTIDDLRVSYRFTNLPSFLALYYEATTVLRTAEDFFDLTRAYLARVRDDGVRHVEVFFDPQSHTSRGVPFEAVVEGIHEALAAGEREHGITAHAIMCLLRDRSAAEAMETLERALPFARWIKGVGLDSAEMGHPPSRFADVFARARRAGLRVVAHAGEEGPPDYVWQALECLGAERIDHGVRSLEDASLVARLARERVPLTVCPLSNVRLGIFPSLQAHNLKRLMDAGLAVTVNSDDPAYFGGYVVDNLVAIAEAVGLTRAHLVRLAATSFEASFLEPACKRRHLQALADYVAGCSVRPA